MPVVIEQYPTDDELGAEVVPLRDDHHEHGAS
jgi:hypothetical protein